MSVIDDYIQQFDGELKKRLVAVANTIRAAAPAAAEKISYRMPTFYLGGNLVHFAAFKNHVGFYPAASGVAAFSNRLKEYKTSKGAIQFLHDGPLPLGLITEIVKFRVAENLSKTGK